MATPVFVDLPSNIWTKIATNILRGQMHLVSTAANVMRYTYIQPTGAAAPANNAALGTPVFEGATTESLSFATGADVYLRPQGAVSRVRVDL